MDITQEVMQKYAYWQQGGKILERRSHSVHQIIESVIQEHSRKPDEVREKIVQLFGDLSKIELFARQEVEGWDCWGNEV